MKPWVLVSDTYSQSRSALATVRALGQAGYPVAVTVSGQISLAAASRFCRRRIRVPPVDDPEYAPSIRAELARNPYLTVLPTSDAALIALGVPVGDYVDKAVLAKRAASVGLAPPWTRTFPSLDALRRVAADLPYPIIVKPSISRSPPFRAQSSEELMTGPAPPPVGQVVVQPYLDEPMRAVCGLKWGERLVGVVHQRYLRIWPPVCGTSSAAETVDPDLEVEERIDSLLRGYEGIFQAQLAGSYLLDLNPRPYGSLPLAVAAGVNLPALYCELLGGSRPPTEVLRSRTGVHYRWIEGDLRTLWNGLRARETSMSAALRALRPRHDTAHSIESLSDPVPTLVRLRAAARRQG
jgi:predicted ATP-grasp superfamily ATP-dependent carboligase